MTEPLILSQPESPVLPFPDKENISEQQTIAKRCCDLRFAADNKLAPQQAKEAIGDYSNSRSITLKAISLWQPWASLIPLGLKHYETRSWKTNYRGKVLICSTAINSKQHKQYLKICEQLQLPPWENFPHGCAIALCDLVDCIEMTAEFISQQSTTEILCGDWQVGRYAWKLENIQPLQAPFAVKGKQGLFSIAVTNLQLLEKGNFSSNSPFQEQSKAPNSKSSDSWYTPLHIVELVIRVLGEIDLDPCADDGRHIRARSHFTASDDGLLRSWEGRVFMNPPYSCPGMWMKKLQAEVELVRVREAMPAAGFAYALLPAATDTNWLSPVLKTQSVCFWKGRIKFLDANYQPKLSARQSHCLVYWGDNPQRFKEVFQKYGVVYLPIPPSNQISSNNQMLGENSSLLISPSTTGLTNTGVMEDNLLLSIPADTQVSDDNQVLGESLLPQISPSTTEPDKEVSYHNPSPIEPI